MCPQPLGFDEGKMPQNQISIPVPPSRADAARDGVLRFPPTVPATESFRRTVLRIWPKGVKEPAIDLVPDPGTETVTPADLFGPAQSAVHVLSGVNSFGRLTRRQEDAETLLALRWRLDEQGWDWRPTVATSPDLQWVEGGALLLDGEPEQVSDLARFHGQSVVLRWDAQGLAAVPTLPGVDVGDPAPVAVRLVPALTGCPLRGGADGVCKVYGGPWTSSSRSAALVWRHHRAMLLEAFGCDVCLGEDATLQVAGAVDLFTPSRQGGWQWAAPRTSMERGG